LSESSAASILAGIEKAARQRLFKGIEEISVAPVMFGSNTFNLGAAR